MLILSNPQVKLTREWIPCEFLKEIFLESNPHPHPFNLDQGVVEFYMAFIAHDDEASAIL